MNQTKPRNRIVKYLEHEIEVPSETPIEEVRENLSEIFPEVGHAKAETDPQGNVTFIIVAGSKGK